MVGHARGVGVLTSVADIHQGRPPLHLTQVDQLTGRNVLHVRVSLEGVGTRGALRVGCIIGSVAVPSASVGSSAVTDIGLMIVWDAFISISAALGLRRNKNSRWAECPQLSPQPHSTCLAEGRTAFLDLSSDVKPIL